MKTPFQKHLLSFLPEGPTPSLNEAAYKAPDGHIYDPIDNQSIKTPTGPELHHDPDAIDNTDDDNTEEEDHITNLPPGLTWDPECGCAVDADGNQYFFQWVTYTPCPGCNPVQALMLTQQMGPYTVAYYNGAWQMLGPGPNGVGYVLYPNMWVFPTGTGAALVIWQSPNGQYWVTMDDPTSNNPPPVWYNPLTGAPYGGDNVDYANWSVYFGFQFGDDGNPINGQIPLLPGGGSGIGDYQWNPPGQIGPGEDAIYINVEIPFGGPDNSGDALRHRFTWNAFAQWYHGFFGEWPPESTWPTNADWWDNWTEGQPDW